MHFRFFSYFWRIRLVTLAVSVTWDRELAQMKGEIVRMSIDTIIMFLFNFIIQILLNMVALILHFVYFGAQRVEKRLLTYKPKCHKNRTSSPDPRLRPVPSDERSLPRLLAPLILVDQVFPLKTGVRSGRLKAHNFSFRILCSIWSSPYCEALSELSPHFFTNKIIEYARWIPIHLQKIFCREEQHPDLAKEYHQGNFVFRKSRKNSSGTSIDQAHEQENAVIKGD